MKYLSTFAILAFVLFTVQVIAQERNDDWEELNPNDPPSPRQGHSMVSLPDGKVVLFGGEGPQVDLLNDLYVFEEEEWTEVEPQNDPPPPRSFHRAWLSGDKMFVFGGKGDNINYNDTWAYDITTKLWEEIEISGTVPEGRYGYSMDKLPNGSHLMVGGKLEFGVSREMYEFNGSSYTPLNDCPVAVSFHPSQVISGGGEIYLLIYTFSSIAFYDYNFGGWSTTTSGGLGIQGHASYLQGQNGSGEDVFFVFGGLDENGDPSDIVYQFNAASGELIQRQDPLPANVTDNAAAKYWDQKYASFGSFDQDYQIVLFGGMVDGELSNATWKSTPNLLNINDIENPISDFSLAPNPATSYTRIKAAQKIDRIRIFDLNGKLLNTLEVGSNEYLLQEALPENGFYLISIDTEKGSACKKLLVFR